MASTLPARERPGTGNGRRRGAVSGGRTLLTVVALLVLPPDAVRSDPLDRLTERLDRLERENRRLRKEVEAIRAEQARRPAPPPAAAVHAPGSDGAPAGFVRRDSRFAYEILDPTDRINRKQRLLLDRRRDGTLAPGGLYFQGAITPIANYQSSNRADKFGYLMRHPTASNQVGKAVSEAAIHSVQLGVTATPGDWIAGHAQMLFDPEQSFGSGTNTALGRN